MNTAQAVSNRQDNAIHWVGYHDDPLKYLAQLIICEQKESLPDLSNVHIIIGESSAAAALRHQLLQEARKHNFAALLGIRIGTLKDWAYQHLQNDIRLCDPQSQELILIEALNQYPDLLGSTSPWVMAENLLNLFSELTLKHVQLPDSPDDFISQLQKAYGESSRSFNALSQEARLIHTLWQAWHTQLQAEGFSDTDSAYLYGLANSLEISDSNQCFYLAGFEQFNPAEINWIQTLINKDQLRLILHGNSKPAEKNYHPDTPLTTISRQLSVPGVDTAKSPYSQFIDSVFDIHKAPLQQRANAFRQHTDNSPVKNHVAVYTASNTEHEAHAIELQIRRWLSKGNQFLRIGVVTENRRLARRVRALLERSKIEIQDASGWALSTTSAAATIERWFECIEEDFDYLALLDLLKSPFLFPEIDQDAFNKVIYRFEQDIIRHENISRSVERYQNALQARRDRLANWSTDTYTLLENILQQLEAAAQPLRAVLNNRQKQTASRLLQQFIESIKQLGIYTAFETDMAGQRFLQALKELERASDTINLSMNWLEFRTWIGRHLERINFQPVQHNSNVQLLGLSQSRLQQFDALIIAAAEQEFLPGKASLSPFFNDTVRKELKLATVAEILSERLYHFRRLLESAPRILITLRGEENGEPVTASPWLDALQSFHQQTYSEVLTSPVLTEMVEEHHYSVIEDTEHQLPGLTRRAMPSVTASDLPGSFSATAYQKLMNCPYQFYASYGLKLKPAEEVSEALARDEYGKRVHRCLESFHTSIDDLPGPFKQQIDNDHRDSAIAMMSDIAHAVFETESEAGFEYQAWLQQWLNIIPYYIDWEITRQQDWQVLRTEQIADQLTDDNILLKGQLDRIDINHQDQLAIIDYKTGQIPKQDEVKQGEYVQLPFYALLNSDRNAVIKEIAYLQLNKAEEIRIKVSLQDDEVDRLKQAIALRLQQLIEMIQNGQPLPAWGDNKTCNFCDMDKLCRRQAWQDND
ncbi:MAG: PD-(D/E)XK nuclease family protein [Gammaproteobacteria bacterium]